MNLGHDVNQWLTDVASCWKRGTQSSTPEWVSLISINGDCGVSASVHSKSAAMIPVSYIDGLKLPGRLQKAWGTGGALIPKGVRRVAETPVAHQRRGWRVGRRSVAGRTTPPGPDRAVGLENRLLPRAMPATVLSRPLARTTLIPLAEWIGRQSASRPVPASTDGGMG